jgi:hypothetical protein
MGGFETQQAEIDSIIVHGIDERIYENGQVNFYEGQYFNIEWRKDKNQVHILDAIDDNMNQPFTDLEGQQIEESLFNHLN